MAMIDILVPRDQEGTEASVGKWLTKTGDPVQEHQPVLEINTDKVSVEIAAPAAGVLVEQTKREGEQVKAGELLGRIETSAHSTPANSALTASSDKDRPHPGDSPGNHASAVSEGLSPAVRRLLRQHSLDVAAIPKLSRGTRVTIQDVEAYLAQHEASSTETPGTHSRKGRMIPHTPMRRSIAAHMTRSVQTAPHVTSVFEADLSTVLRDRDKRKEAAGSEDVPSITAYLIRAAIEAIREVPRANSRWHDDHLEIFDWIDFGVAAALDSGGLVVPIIRDAHALSLIEISSRLRTLTGKARSGKLTKADLEGGTFTLSNHGVSGSLLAMPIVIPYGQVAVLGTGKLQKRVIVSDTGGRELFRVRPMMYVTLTVDHRALNGHEANAFLSRFVSALETPTGI